jgi:large subunit ribosomal protein L6e
MAPTAKKDVTKPAAKAAATPAVAGDKKKKSGVEKKKLTTLQKKCRLMKQKYTLGAPKRTSKRGYPQVKLRYRLRPKGTIVIVLGNCTKLHRGRRMIFLKQLETGDLLLASPNTLTLMPTLQVVQASYVIATTTRIPLTPACVEAAEKVTFNMFKKANSKKTTDKKKRDGSIFADDQTQAKSATVETIDPELEKTIDSELMKSIANFNKGDTLDAAIMKKYLRTRFTIKNGEYPHQMKF